jgi:hypothetical protein
MSERKLWLNHEMCALCGGKCCKHLPGAAYPGDFENEAMMTEAILSRKWAIDWWEGDPGDGEEETAYYVRPATLEGQGAIYDASWGGQCVFLTDSGCQLRPEKRPTECRFLEPRAKEGNACIMHNDVGKRTAALVWRKHYRLLDSFHDKEGRTLE